MTVLFSAGLYQLCWETQMKMEPLSGAHIVIILGVVWGVISLPYVFFTYREQSLYLHVYQTNCT
jgi:hypothetical protein